MKIRLSPLASGSLEASITVAYGYPGNLLKIGTAARVVASGQGLWALWSLALHPISQKKAKRIRLESFLKWGLDFSLIFWVFFIITPAEVKKISGSKTSRSGHATPVRTWDLSASDFSNILGTAHKSKGTKKNRPLPLSPQPLFRNFLIFTFNQVNTFQ